MPRHGPRPASPAEAVHIVSAGCHPEGARDVIGLSDSLTLGPSHTDHETHGALRAEYWRTFERIRLSPAHRGPSRMRPSRRDARSARQLLAALGRFPDSTPLVLWTSANPRDRVAFRWMHDALRLDTVPGSRTTTWRTRRLMRIF